MRHQYWILFHGIAATSGLVCGVSTIAQAGDVLTIQNPTPFAASVTVSDAIRNECDLTFHIPDYVRDFVGNKNYDKVVMLDNVEKVASGQALKSIIIDVGGSQYGGGWTGYKSLTVQGSLYEDGQVKGTFSDLRHRSTSIIPMKNMGSTCAQYNSIAKRIGSDIAIWLKAPTMDAHLGDK